MGITEWIREIAAWPDWPNLHDQLSPWRDYATLGIAVIVWRVLVARQSQTEQIAAFFLAQRHQADIERYRDSAELHRALAQTSALCYSCISGRTSLAHMAFTRRKRRRIRKGR